MMARMVLYRCGASLALALACGANTPPSPSAPDAGGVATATAAPSSPEPTTATPVEDAAASDPAAPPAATDAVFPPPDFAPPFERTAKEGDGRWAPMEMAGGEPPVLWMTKVHPHPIKKFVVVAIVAIDRQRVGLHLVAGTEEPESKAVPASERPGLVPREHLSSLIAAMNGGFKTRHGKHGMMLGGAEFGRPNEGSCTIAELESGRLEIASWPALAARASDMRWYRQTPPCMIEAGALHTLLQADTNTKKWGASETGETEIRRSAMGVSADGRTLYFAIGDWTTAQSLARALALAGAHGLAELDINYSFTRFTLYEHQPDGSLKAHSPLLPELKFTQKGYIESPAHRDFFYLRHLP